MDNTASAIKPAQTVVLDVFCSRVGDDWLVMLDPTWAPQYLLHSFDSNYEIYPVQLNLEDLERTMSARGANYSKRFATTGSVELSAEGEAADVLATWLSTAFASSVRPSPHARARG